MQMIVFIGLQGSGKSTYYRRHVGVMANRPPT